MALLESGSLIGSLLLRIRVRTRLSDRVNRGHFGDIMFEQRFDAVLQGRGRGRAARTGALHLQIDIALVEAAIDDVAAVIGNRGADARFDEIDRKSTRLNSSH